MPYDIKVSETQELGVFLLAVNDIEMVRLKNIGTAAGTDVRGVIEEMLRDAIGMCNQLLEAAHPDLAAAITEAARRADAKVKP